MKLLTTLVALLVAYPAWSAGTGGCLWGHNCSPAVDPLTGAVESIDYAHHEVHEGSSFGVGYSVTTAVANDQRTSIGFRTPNTTNRFHLIVTVSTSDPAEFFLREAPTINDGAGTQQVVYNRSRNSTVTSTVGSLEAVPTVGSVTTFTEAQLAAAGLVGGTQLEYVLIGGGQGARTVGGTTRGSQEWILKQNTKYLFTLQNTTAVANTHVVHLDWYEHSE